VKSGLFGFGKAKEFGQVDPKAAVGALPDDQVHVFENEFGVQHSRDYINFGGGIRNPDKIQLN
jgi:hypothetical protein